MKNVHYTESMESSNAVQPVLCPFFSTTPYLLDFVAGAGDALCDALVGPDGSGKFSIMLNYQLI